MTWPAIVQYAAAWLLPLLLGVVLLRAGFKGRKINDHPICRTCRFDLIGLGTIADPPAHCPECGTNLHPTQATPRRHPIIRGQRKRQPIPIVLGILAILAAASTLAWVTYKPLAKFPWTAWAPDRLLVEFVDTSDPAKADLVARELLQRIQLNELGSHSATRMADKILARQADLATPWEQKLGVLFETARAGGTIDDDRWLRYAKQAVTLELDVRPQIEAEGRIPWALSQRVRTGSSRATFLLTQNATINHTTFGMNLESVEVRLNDEKIKHAPSMGYSTTGIYARELQRSHSSWFAFPTPPVGHHTGSVTFRIAMYDAKPDAQSIEDLTILIAREVTLPFEFEVVEKGVPPIVLKSDPAIAPLIASAFNCKSFRTTLDPQGRECIELNLICQSLPVPVAFDVEGTLHHPDGTEVPVSLNWMTLEAGQNTHHLLTSEPVPAPPPGTTLSLTLIPSPKVAVQTVHLTEIWGESVTLSNIPLESGKN